MALPKLQTPTYELVLPSSGEKIKYRPFLVREQKVLLMAQESNNEDEIANAMGDIVSTCTFDKVDPKCLKCQRSNKDKNTPIPKLISKDVSDKGA